MHCRHSSLLTGQRVVLLLLTCWLLVGLSTFLNFISLPNPLAANNSLPFNSSANSTSNLSESGF